jgi:hypothetical protein
MKHSVYIEDHLLLNHKNCHVHRSLNISRVFFVNGHTSYVPGPNMPSRSGTYVPTEHLFLQNKFDVYLTYKGFVLCTGTKLCKFFVKF